jgi:hypothetical protein
VIFTQPIAVGAVVFSLIYAPSGKMLEIFALQLRANPIAGATTGAHAFSILVTSTMHVLDSIVDYNEKLLYYSGIWEKPVGAAADVRYDVVHAYQHCMKCDVITYLRFEYRNATDAIQTSNVSMYYGYKLVTL